MCECMCVGIFFNFVKTESRELGELTLLPSAGSRTFKTSVGLEREAAKAFMPPPTDPDA